MTPPTIESPLELLAGTRRAMVTMSWLAMLGLAFWLLVCVVVAFGAQGRVAEGSYSPIVATLTWSLIGVPVLLHIWPIFELRRAAKALAVFAANPSEAAAVVAVRAQRLYWRAAAICHLSLLVWVILAILSLSLVIAWENNQPQTLRLLDAQR